MKTEHISPSPSRINLVSAFQAASQSPEHSSRKTDEALEEAGQRSPPIVIPAARSKSVVLPAQMVEQGMRMAGIRSGHSSKVLKPSRMSTDAQGQSMRLPAILKPEGTGLANGQHHWDVNSGSQPDQTGAAGNERLIKALQRR
jgi:hypothetical protein